MGRVGYLLFVCGLKSASCLEYMRGGLPRADVGGCQGT